MQKYNYSYLYDKFENLLEAWFCVLQEECEGK